MNRMYCDVEMEPDGGVIVIEDAGAQSVTGLHIHPGAQTTDRLPRRALWVHTMTAEECVTADRLLRVRVLLGEDRRGLGELAFDGRLAVSSGVLAIGDTDNPGRRLLSGMPAIAPVSVLVANEIDTVDLGDGTGAAYPVSGPSDVTVLLHDVPEDADVACTSAPRTSRIRRRRKQGTP